MKQDRNLRLLYQKSSSLRVFFFSLEIQLLAQLPPLCSLRLTHLVPEIKGGFHLFQKDVVLQISPDLLGAGEKIKRRKRATTGQPAGHPWGGNKGQRKDDYILILISNALFSFIMAKQLPLL